MEPIDDPNLSKLLREWQVPDPPRSLDQRVLGKQKRWWEFLFTGSIRIPVPVGLAMAAIVLTMAIALFRERTPQATSAAISLIDFRPVSDLNVRVIRSHESN
jgi:hypothetical protein